MARTKIGPVSLKFALPPRCNYATINFLVTLEKIGRWRLKAFDGRGDGRQRAAVAKMAFD